MSRRQGVVCCSCVLQFSYYSPLVPCARVIGLGLILAGMAEENPRHNALSLVGCNATFSHM